MAIMAGRAYCTSNFPTGFVPSSNVVLFLSINNTLIQCAKLASFDESNNFSTEKFGFSINLL